MTPHRDADHTNPEELLDYFEAKLPEGRELFIEEHLALCDACTQAARAVYSFHEVWDHWTARSHGEAYLRERLASALHTAEEQATNPMWRERLKHWRLRWAGRAEAALRVVTEASEQASRTVAEKLDALARPGSFWEFAPVAQAVPVRGETLTRSESAALATSVSLGHPRARVVVHGGRAGALTVRIDDVQPGDLTPLVLLTGATEGGEALLWLTEVEREPGVEYAIARFDDLPPGDYVVAFEPLAG